MLVTTSHQRKSAIALESKSCASPTKYPADRCPRRPARDQDRRRDGPPAGEALEDADQADGDLRGPADRPRVAHLLAVARTPMNAGERSNANMSVTLPLSPSCASERLVRADSRALESPPSRQQPMPASHAPAGSRERPRGALARAPDPRPSKPSTSPAHPRLRKKGSASSLAAVSRSGAALAVERTRRHSASGEPENPPLLLPRGVSDDRRVNGTIGFDGKQSSRADPAGDRLPRPAAARRAIGLATHRSRGTLAPARSLRHDLDRVLAVDAVAGRSAMRSRRGLDPCRRDASTRSAPMSSLLLVQLSHGASGGVIRPTGRRSIGLGDLEPRAGIIGANCCRIQCQLPAAGHCLAGKVSALCGGVPCPKRGAERGSGR